MWDFLEKQGKGQQQGTYVVGHLKLPTLKSTAQLESLCHDWLRHFDFSSETTKKNSTKLDRKQDLNVLYQLVQVCVFSDQPEKTRWLPWPIIGWDIIFHLFSETAEQNSRKLVRKQDLNVLYQVCVFGPIGKQDGHPGLWLVETFSTSPLKLLNRIQENLSGSKGHEN